MDENTKCEKSPDKKHHYEVAGFQHLVMNHCDYTCTFCGRNKCVHTTPLSISDPLSLPTDDQLDSR